MELLDRCQTPSLAQNTPFGVEIDSENQHAIVRAKRRSQRRGFREREFALESPAVVGGVNQIEVVVAVPFPCDIQRSKGLVGVVSARMYLSIRLFTAASKRESGTKALGSASRDD